MPSTKQYEVVSIHKSGEVRKSYSTDYLRALDAYNEVRDYLFKVLWEHVEHENYDPKILRSHNNRFN